MSAHIKKKVTYTVEISQEVLDAIFKACELSLDDWGSDVEACADFMAVADYYVNGKGN